MKSELENVNRSRVEAGETHVLTAESFDSRIPIPESRIPDQ
jgi:hypothetical protein